MKNSIALVISLATLFLVSCATRPAKEPMPPAPDVPAVEGSVDVVGLQRSLGMERAPQQLGYEEKAFNTCSVGFGYSSSHDCRVQYLVVVQFHLQCRDTNGTVSTTDHVLTPVFTNELKWTLGSTTGTGVTDAEGFGQIVRLSDQSQRHQWLRLTVDGKFLALRAGTITRVVAPRAWCEKSY